MFRRSLVSAFAATRVALSGGGGGTWPEPDHIGGSINRYEDKAYPNMPHELAHNTHDLSVFKNNPIMGKMLDQYNALYDDQVTGSARALFQDPARAWYAFDYASTVIMEEHDREEWNDKPYVTVNHLYEPPSGSEERPIRVEAYGNPGDNQLVACFGDCAPHVPQSMYVMIMKGYAKNKCPMCQQWYYIHNRPWLIMHPDWTDEPAADEGPAYTFAEIESEFDRDFHEFGVYLNIE
jgi:hypothetical protein